MGWSDKAVEALSKAFNSNTVINTLLVGSFVTLSIRSVNQQNEIEALEAEKDSLLKTNKSMKKSMWDWKQQLFAEAEAEAEANPSSVVSLSRLKVIYGEAPITHQAVNQAPANGDGKTPQPKFVI